MFNLYHAYKPVGKVVYYIPQDKVRIVNENGKRNGKEQALNYCETFGINPETIIKFDSKLECDRFEFLKNLEDKGTIKNLKHHQVIELQPEFENAVGDKINAITYNADFTYEYNETVYVEDVKGASLFQDTRFEVVKQLFDYKFKSKNIYLKIVIWREGAWREWKMGEYKKPRTLIKKQSEKNKELKKQLHEKELEEKKINRYIETYTRLKAKEKLTSAEKTRFKEVEEFLKGKNRIL